MEEQSTISRPVPLVSIITVVYNGEKLLANAIGSVINQTYPNIEYIVIDGGSSDNTINIIKKYEKNIAYWVSEKDGGIYDALNKGIAKARGELIGIINSDDWYELDAVAIVADNYVKNPGFDVYYGLARFWDQHSKLISVQGYTHEYLEHGMISHPTCFVKKTAYAAFGKFDTAFKIAADYHLMLGYKQQGAKFYFIEKLVANFRDGGVSTSSKYELNNEVLRIKLDKGVISKKNYYLKRIFLWLKSKLLPWLN